jgi:histidinol-phosphatase (PHP family)
MNSPIQLPPDYHMHTALCKHATGTPAEYRSAAAAAGIPQMCFTDHSPEPSGYDARHRMQIGQFPEYRNMVAALRDGGTPDVLFGIEADYYPAGEAFLREFLPRQEMDYVLGSIHYIKDWGFDNPDYREVWASVDVKGVWKEYFRLMDRLVEMRLFDAIGHFDLPKKFGHRLRDRDLTEFAQPLLDKVMKSGMAIEINTSGLRREAAEVYPSPLILALMREREIPICFGSDAHEAGHVGYKFAEAVSLAREAGYTTSLRFRQRLGTAAPF